MSTEQFEKAATLMAAAPELLEALKAACQHLEWIGYGDNYERECALPQLEKQIKAAIAKAEGREA